MPKEEGLALVIQHWKWLVNRAETEGEGVWNFLKMHNIIYEQPFMKGLIDSLNKIATYQTKKLLSTKPKNKPNN